MLYLPLCTLVSVPLKCRCPAPWDYNKDGMRQCVSIRFQKSDQLTKSIQGKEMAKLERGQSSMVWGYMQRKVPLQESNQGQANHWGKVPTHLKPDSHLRALKQVP